MPTLALCSFQYIQFCTLHRLITINDLFFQIIAAVFAVGLAIRYFSNYREDKMYDQVEKMPRLKEMDHKVSYGEDSSDQVDGNHQSCSSQNVDNFQRSIASNNGGIRRPGNKHLSRMKTISEASSINIKTKLIDRRRTVSEGHCANESQSSDDNRPEVIRTDSSPPRMEHKERNLDECKTILKQSVCHTYLIFRCYPS